MIIKRPKRELLLLGQQIRKTKEQWKTNKLSPFGQEKGGQSIGASASTLVLPMSIEFTGLISLLSQGFSRVFLSTTIQNHQFFIVGKVGSYLEALRGEKIKKKKLFLTHSGYRLNSVPVILVQRSLFLCWLSAEYCSQSLRLLEVPSQRSFPSQQWKNIVVLTPSQASYLFDFLFYLLEKTNFMGLSVCINTCKCSPFCHIL